jgi:hypothetical protein
MAHHWAAARVLRAYERGEDQSMKRPIKYFLKPGGEGDYVYIEVDEPAAEGGADRASSLGEKVEEATQSLDEALDQIKPAARAVFAKLADVAADISEISMEFGVKLDTKLGAMFASASVEAQYTVSLKWQRAHPVTPTAQQ